MVLRSAAVRRNGGGAPQRITQALACLRTQPAAERLLKGTLSGDGATAGVGCLRGEWLLGLTAAGGKLDFANQVLRREGEGAGGTYERRVRGAFPTLTSVAGSFEARCRAADADATSAEAEGGMSVRLTPTQASIGPLPLPTPPPSLEEVLLLDETLCVLQPTPAEFTVWVRPSMASGADDDGEY